MTSESLGVNPSAPLPPDRQVKQQETEARASKVASNILATLFGNLFPPLAMLITAPILAQGLGVTARGQVAGASAPLILATTAATIGIPQSVTYFVARSPAIAKQANRIALWLIAIAGVICAIVIALGARWLGAGDATISTLIVISSFAIVPSLLIAVLRGTASGLHLWRSVTTERILSSMTRLIALLALFSFGALTPLSAIIVISVGPLVGAAAYLKMSRHYVPGIESMGPSAPVIMNYGVRTWVGAVSGILLSRLDQTIMTPLASAYELGLYAVAVTISEVPLIINSAVRDVTLSADASDNQDNRLAASARISSSACAALGLVVGLSMLWWLPILFGQEFRPAIGPSAVLIIAVVLGTPGSIAGAGLGARGHPGLRSTSLIVACVVNVVALVLLVPTMGAMGAAIATLIGNLISANLNIVFLQRKFGLDPRQFFGLRRRDIAIVSRFVSKLRQR